jgi:pimeloyl-ACP methyl ester carboxylesterase
MEKTIIFIHGMFQNPKSWEQWIKYFEVRGYKCLAPAWPLHAGDPEELRIDVPDGLGNLRLETVIDFFTDIVSSLPSRPILIGHSVGGLIVQNLLNKGLGELGVVISSVAPNGMLVLDWGMFKNAIAISNPLMGDEPYYMDSEGFHKSFCNTMTEEEANKAFEEFAVHDSRNIFRDCMKEAGKVNLNLSHAPLLFVAAEKDQICPAELNKKNCEGYTDHGSVTEFKEFPNRGHFICGQPGWEEVAAYVSEWVEKHIPVLQEAHVNY